MKTSLILALMLVSVSTFAADLKCAVTGETDGRNLQIKLPASGTGSLSGETAVVKFEAHAANGFISSMELTDKESGAASVVVLQQKTQFPLMALKTPNGEKYNMVCFILE